MTDRPCESVRELLIDYADDELQADERHAVDGHVRECAECRAQVARLRRSLDIACSIWDESVISRDSDGHSRRTGGGRAKWSGYRVAAAAVVAIVAVGLVWSVRQRMGRGTDAKEVAREDGNASEREGHVPPLDTSRDAEDLEAFIYRRAQSARLAAAARVLASDPTLRSYQQRAENYLATAYGMASEPPADMKGTGT